MKKIERRAFVCLALALLLAAGLGVFLVKYFADGGSWASSAFNRHLYNSSGELASGTVLDRDGDVLSEVVDGRRTYYDSATVRKATLHAVGDLQGNIGTGALNAFADKLTGYSLLNGAFGAQQGSDLYLTIDARYNYTAYEALGGKSGTVAVYNYETGEILCMVSAPSYDPLNVPEDITTNDRYEGAYLNRFLSSTFTPGSVYKTVTLAAALEEIPDQVFSQGVLGEGVGIEPTGSVVLAPADGEVSTVMEDSGHACGLLLDNGVELLIHVGMDTVSMAGDGFQLHVKEGDRVRLGDKLITFDPEKIRQAGHPTTTAFVVTEPADFTFSFHTGQTAEAGKTTVITQE